MGCGCNPTQPSSSAAGGVANVDILGDVGPVVPSSSTPTPDGPDHLASAVAGAAAFPTGALMLVSAFSVARGNATAPGLVRAGTLVEYSFDSGGTWLPAPGGGTAVFTSIDNITPAFNTAMAAAPIDVSGQSKVRFRVQCNNGVGAVDDADFDFVRVLWIYSGKNV